MRVTRDPAGPHLQHGGHYVGNMGQYSFYLDDVHLDNEDVISADNEAGEVEIMQRDAQGVPLFVDGVLQTTIKKGVVRFTGREESCTGCSEKNRIHRQKGNWWLM